MIYKIGFGCSVYTLDSWLLDSQENICVCIGGKLHMLLRMIEIVW